MILCNSKKFAQEITPQDILTCISYQVRALQNSKVFFVFLFEGSVRYLCFDACIQCWFPSKFLKPASNTSLDKML